MDKNILDADSSIVEPLTRRETDVLLLLADNLLDREIAERLSLALSSVKGYTRQIYGKLGVDNRRAAVAKARNLGLLGPAWQGIAFLPPHNLPRQISNLVGREKESARLLIQVREHALVTLTGAGGIGKTRLALALADSLVHGEHAAAFPDGIWFVELAALSDPRLVAQTVANVLGVHEEHGLSILDGLLNHLRNRQILLLMDNCEHLVDACADLISRILRVSPGVKVLACSRELLGLPGETAVRVPSLAFPQVTKVGKETDLAGLEQYEAIRLFLDRTQAVQPSFQLTQQNAGFVIQICQRLEGIPLAIELAAARVGSLEVGQIAARLERTLRLLSGGLRSVTERQRTLRATIEWSYQLLSPTERTLLKRLSVFAGGWTLEAAEKVCAGDEISAEDIPDLLAQLVNKSMVATYFIADNWIGTPLPGYEMRYRLLKTLHQYVQDQMQETDEKGRLRDLHLDYYLSLVETLEPELHTGGRLDRFYQLYTELDNLRNALAWALDDSAETHALEGVRLATGLAVLWWFSELHTEGFPWMEKGLAFLRKYDPDNTCLLAKTLLSLAQIQCRQDRLRECRRDLEEAVKRYRECGRDQLGLSIALAVLGESLFADLENTRARQLMDESLALSREVGDPWVTAYILAKLAELAQYSKDFDLATTCAKESIDLYYQSGDKWGAICPMYILSWIHGRKGELEKSREYSHRVVVLYNEQDRMPFLFQDLGHFGETDYYLGDFDQMELDFQQTLAVSQEIKLTQRSAFALLMLAVATKRKGQLSRAVNYCLESLEKALDFKYDPYRTFACLEEMAEIAVAAGQPLEAARLFGAAEGSFPGLVIVRSPVDQIEFERDLELTRRQLGEQGFQAAFTKARKLTIDQAIQELRVVGEELSNHLTL